MKFLRHSCFLYLTLILSFTAASMIGSKLFDAIAVYSTQLTAPEMTIVLDAGHGGEDGGAVSCTGVRESQINLEITTRMNDLLHLLGCRTQLLRSEDKSLSSADITRISEKKLSDLKNRVKYINAQQEAVLVSIHQNHFSQSQYRGAQVFYANDSASKQFAVLTQESLRKGLDPANKREIKPADGIFIMEQIHCPGILVECGFLSNPEEEALLRTASYQKKLATVLSVAVGAYLSESALLS